MLNPLTVLPLHLACQFLISENYTTFVNVDIANTSPKLATEFPPGYVVLPNKGVAYKYHNYKTTWNVARQICISEGGYLAVIDSREKYDIVLDMNKSGTHMHAGFHRLFGEDEWVDVNTGLPSTIPWRPDRIYGANRDCAALIFDRSGIVAIGCNEPYAFVCEISIFRN